MGFCAPGLVALALAGPPIVPLPPDPDALELHWEAPSPCPGADELEARIEALLHGQRGGEGVLRIDGVVVASAEGFTLELASTFRGETERRSLAADACTELADATALLIAVALEPGARLDTSGMGMGEAPPVAPATTIAVPTTTTRAVEAPAELGPPFPPTDAPLPSQVGRPRRRLEALALRFAAGLELGAMAAPTAALQAAVALLWPRARAELHGVWLSPRTRTEDGHGGTYQLGAIGARGCGRLFVGAVELPLCAGLEGGIIRARTRGLARETIVLGPWVGALASIGVARAWGPVGVWSAAELAGRVTGSRFRIGRETALRQWPVSVRLLVGLELRVPWKRGVRGH